MEDIGASLGIELLSGDTGDVLGVGERQVISEEGAEA